MKRNMVYLLILLIYINIAFANSLKTDGVINNTSNSGNEINIDNEINNYIDITYKSSNFIKQRIELEKMMNKLSEKGEKNKVFVIKRIIKALNEKHAFLLKMEEKSKQEKLDFFHNEIGKISDFNGKLIRREYWGADESFGTPKKFLSKCGGNCWVKTSPKKMKQIDINYIKNFGKIDKDIFVNKTGSSGLDLTYYPVSRIIIHHTAFPLAKTKKQGIDQIKSIYRYHSLDLGWGDIGYHYLIDGEGNVYEGHSGGKYVIGAHIYGNNYGSVGISLMSSGKYTEKQLNSLKELVVYIAKEYNLDITKKALIRNYMQDGERVQDIVVAHKELDTGKPLDPDINMNDFRRDISKIYNESYNLKN